MELYFLLQPQYYWALNLLKKCTALQGYACKRFSVFLSIQYAKTAHLQVKLPPSLKRVSGPQGSNQELCVAHKGK